MPKIPVAATSHGSATFETRHHEWAGSPREIGQQHGESEREAISTFCDYIIERHSDRSNAMPTAPPISSHIADLASTLEVFDSSAFEELCGISQGANRPLKEIVAINAFLDALPLEGSRADNAAIGCTSAAICNNFQEDHDVLVAQNFDVWGALRPLAITANISSADTPTALVFTFSGVLGCAGLNEHGIGLTIKYLDGGRGENGLLYPSLVRRALAQRRIGDAMGAIVLPRRGCSMHYMLGSAEGVVIGLETTPDAYATIASDTDRLVHTNHFVADRMLALDALLNAPAFDQRLTRPGSSLIRKHVADRIIGRSAPSLDLQTLERVLTDHTNFPYSICFHGDETIPVKSRSQTVASLILDLETRTMNISNGSHHGPYQQLKL